MICIGCMSLHFLFMLSVEQLSEIKEILQKGISELETIHGESFPLVQDFKHVQDLINEASIQQNAPSSPPSKRKLPFSFLRSIDLNLYKSYRDNFNIANDELQELKVKHPDLNEFWEQIAESINKKAETVDELKSITKETLESLDKAQQKFGKTTKRLFDILSRMKDKIYNIP